MNWKLMDDAANEQNPNAGNGGDLVKHTVYLATLDFLLKREPWRDGMRVRECHAGRGIYHLTAAHKSRALLSCLQSIRATGETVLLESAQHSILRDLGCWPDTARNVEQHIEWYAGSALINARRLADHPGSHTLDLYELKPETRQILRSVLMDMQLPTRLSWNIPSDGDETKDFDGEGYIEREIGRWGSRDLILLDPFALWISQEDQKRRDRYGRFFDALIQRGNDAASLMLFWVWGSQNQHEALKDLDSVPRDGINSGYQGLRSRLHGAGIAFVRVRWCWGQWFAMWIAVPGLSAEHLAELEHEIEAHCRSVTALWRRCGHRTPELEVRIDRS